MSIVCNVYGLGGGTFAATVEPGTLVKQLKRHIASDHGERPQDIDLVSGETALSDELAMSDVAEKLTPSSRKHEQQGQQVELMLVKKARTRDPLLCLEDLAKFKATNLSDEPVEVSLYVDEDRIDSHTLEPQETWTYAEIWLNWQEKQVWVYFESGHRISDDCEGRYLVQADAANAALTQKWCCASPARSSTNEIEWDLDSAEKKVFGVSGEMAMTLDPLLCVEDLAAFKATNLSEDLVDVSLYIGGNRIDSRTLRPQESWTYAEICRDSPQKEVWVYFDSGDCISDCCEGRYLVQAESAYDDLIPLLTQEWYCASNPDNTDEIEWDLDRAQERAMGERGECSEGESNDSDEEEPELSDDVGDACKEETC